MKRTNQWTIAAGILLVMLGGLWMLSNVTDVSVPFRWIVPGFIVFCGLALIFSRDGRDGPPPSQFERNDAPPVP